MAGEFAIVTGTPTTVPTTSFVTLDYGSVTTDDDNILTETSAGVYRPDEAGIYLILAEWVHDQSHNNRLTMWHKLQKNDTDVAGAWGSSYSRRNQSPLGGGRLLTILQFDGSTDDFRIQHQRAVSDGTPAGSYTATRIKVIRLTDTETGLPYGHYQTPTNTSLTGSTLTAVAGWDVVTETDTSVVELQVGGTSVRFKEADRPYLVVYGLKNDDTGAGRTHRVATVFHNSSRVYNGDGYAYQRDSDNEYSVPSGMALIRPTTANQDMDIRGCGYLDNLAVHWGTWDNGSWSIDSAAGGAGFAVIALPSTADIAIYEDTTGNQSWSGTATSDINLFRTTVGTEDSPFSRSSNTAVDVTSATDVLFWGTAFNERTASSGTRWNRGMRVEKEGVDQSQSEMMDYERGEQSSDDCKNAVVNVSYVGAVSANDTFNVEMYTPTGVTDTGGNNSTSWAGSFFIDLASLEPEAADESGILNLFAHLISS